MKRRGRVDAVKALLAAGLPPSSAKATQQSGRKPAK